MTAKDDIIKLIEANKISTTEVADVLGKTGALAGILPVNPRHFRTGEVVFVYAYKSSNWHVHEQIADIDCENKIVYIHAIDCEGRAVIGDLISKYLFLYKRCKAIVTNAPVRDSHRLIKENYPVWSAGVSPIGCSNIKNVTLPREEDLNKLKERYEGSVMVCDDGGVVLIEKDKLQSELIEKLHFIELQEDVWYFCLDVLKMSTYDIVCLKKYLAEGLIDKEKLMQLSKFTTAS